MGKMVLLAAVIMLLTGCARYQDIPIKLTSVQACTGDTSAERVGNCYIRGEAVDGQDFKGPIFTMGKKGEWVTLQCGPRLRCRSIAPVQ